MGLARRFAEQLARPQGLAGRLIGHAMDIANRRPTRLALDLLDAQPGERVLDAGCGTGVALEMLLEAAPVRAWGIDPSPTMLAAAKRRLQGQATLEQIAIEDICFEEGAFDAVLLLNVLYFAGKDGRMIRQLHRVLRPGGRIVAYVTALESMEGWPFARQGVHRLFDAESMAATLADAGFARQRICVHRRAITASVDGLIAVATKDD